MLILNFPVVTSVAEWFLGRRSDQLGAFRATLVSLYLLIGVPFFFIYIYCSSFPISFVSFVFVM